MKFLNNPRTLITEVLPGMSAFHFHCLSNLVKITEPLVVALAVRTFTYFLQYLHWSQIFFDVEFFIKETHQLSNQPIHLFVLLAVHGPRQASAYSQKSCTWVRIRACKDGLYMGENKVLRSWAVHGRELGLARMGCTWMSMMIHTFYVIQF